MFRGASRPRPVRDSSRDTCLFVRPLPPRPGSSPDSPSVPTPPSTPLGRRFFLEAPADPPSGCACPGTDGCASTGRSGAGINAASARSRSAMCSSRAASCSRRCCASAWARRLPCSPYTLQLGAQRRRPLLLGHRAHRALVRARGDHLVGW